ncbi:MAG: PP2C family protein-serine/threonine phosphatase [Noviherbaspirillum sp.]
MTDASHFRWTSAARSHVGLVRKINEDACLDQPARKLWAVADGMGGHTLGDVASRMVVEGLETLPEPGSLAQFTADARDCLQTVNRHLLTEAAIRNAQLIGSTVVVLLAYDRHCTCLWAGDSRIYLCRSGQLKQLTRDHSQVAELISRGTLSPGDALNHPARNLITRAVGAADTLDLDEETLEVNDGDVFLLCSDGLSNAVSEQELRAVLIPGDCAQAADALIGMALQQGGRDNISVVVVRAEDPDSTDRTVLNPAL